MSTDKPLTKTQLLNLLAEKTDLKKQQVAQVLEALAEIAYQEAKTKEKGFTLPGFGKLVLVDRPERMGRNPRTGEQIKIPAKKVVKFRIAKIAKDSILG